MTNYRSKYLKETGIRLLVNEDYSRYAVWLEKELEKKEKTIEELKEDK